MTSHIESLETTGSGIHIAQLMHHAITHTPGLSAFTMLYITTVVKLAH